MNNAAIERHLRMGADSQTRNNAEDVERCEKGLPPQAEGLCLDAPGSMLLHPPPGSYTFLILKLHNQASRSLSDFKRNTQKSQ